MSRDTVTSQHVAKKAGVSQSAVSRVFSEGASASAAMTEKVQKAALELGYRPNILARSLITGKSKIIGLVVAYLENQFYPEALEKLSLSLQERGYHVLVFMATMTDDNVDQLLDELLDFQVDGIVMASASMSSDLARRCKKAGVPVVLFNRYVPSTPASSVTSDNLHGGSLVADFLVRGGHERIAFVAGDEDASTNRDREAGFYKGLAAHGMTPSDRVVGGYGFERAAEAARTLFSREIKPDAVFVANDHMAFAVMDGIREELGLRVPEDVSIVGFDDVPEAAWKGYQLTTVTQRIPDMIEATMSILLEQIEHQTVKKRAAVVGVNLVVRGSARIPV